MSLFIIHLFHIIIVGSLFLYVGIEQSKIPSFLYYILLYLGIFVILYQSYNVYKDRKNEKYLWVYLLHILIIGPLMIYIGINNVKTPQYSYELLLMLGFAAIGYHGYYLLVELLKK